MYFGYSEPNPSALKLRITSRTRSSLVNATFAIAATFMPWAGSSTICALRQVTIDPLPRRMIRTRRRPSSSSISRTRRCSVTAGDFGTSARRRPSRPVHRNLASPVPDARQGRRTAAPPSATTWEKRPRENSRSRPGANAQVKRQAKPHCSCI